MSRFGVALALATLLPASSFAADQWIVVTAPAFRTAVEPLCQHRKSRDFACRSC